MLILASRSPQRRAILAQLGIRFDAVAPDVEELEQGEPRDLVLENAVRKARAAEGERILGADTTVVSGERILGKPGDEGEARSFLESLCGRRHEVWSALALIEGGRERTAAAVTVVRFRSLEPADIDWYVASGEWKGRAGGYAIQGRGAALVDSIEGDYTNVVGLPVAELVAMAPHLVRGA